MAPCRVSELEGVAALSCGYSDVGGDGARFCLALAPNLRYQLPHALMKWRILCVYIVHVICIVSKMERKYCNNKQNKHSVCMCVRYKHNTRNMGEVIELPRRGSRCCSCYCCCCCWRRELLFGLLLQAPNAKMINDVDGTATAAAIAKREPERQDFVPCARYHFGQPKRTRRLWSLRAMHETRGRQGEHERNSTRPTRTSRRRQRRRE